MPRNPPRIARTNAYIALMAGYDTGLILGAILMGVIALIILSSLLRSGAGRVFRNGAAWIIIFIVAVAGFGLWDDIRSDFMPRQTVFSDQGRVEVPRSQDGHYYMTAEVNGTPINFVVDTGASEIVLTKEDAERAGLSVDQLQFFGRASTANGEVRTAPVRLDSVDIGGIRDTDVPAFVNEGQMFQSLLGMSYLNRWDRLEIADGTLLLMRD